MSHFSRIQLDHRHLQAREALAQAPACDAYSDHQWLWQFFRAPPGTARDFVFRRMDPEARREQPLFYVVSQRQPEPLHAAWRVQSREYAPKIRLGDRLSFELRVNPVRARYEERRGGIADAYRRQRQQDGRRVPDGVSLRKEYDDVVMHAKREIIQHHGVARWSQVPREHRPETYELVHDAVSAWFCGGEGRPGIIDRHGFRAIPASLRVDAYRSHRLPRQPNSDIQLSTADLSGVLEVTDIERAVAALRYGIGRARAFGCGLLLVRRA